MTGKLLGRVVAGKFEIEQHVGSGAMGEVYRARHVVLDSVIALKIMRPDIAKDAMFKERFYREAKAASRLEHPNSVRVLDFGVEGDGLVYLAMEFLHGRDLLALLREEWPLSDQRIVDLMVQTLGAVSTAHSLGIVHRDLKPENIMVAAVTEDDGTMVDRVKVCDFGIAKLNDPRGFQTDGGKPLTTSGTLIGTPEYMSPEQARGDPLDARSDVYSLGVVLYQLLTGKLPFTAENALGVVLKQVMDEPVAPSTVRPGVNARLEAICMRAMKKSRDDRYPTAKEMRADLRAVFGYRPNSMPDDSSPDLRVMAPSGAALESAATMVEDERKDTGGGDRNTAAGPTIVAPVAAPKVPAAAAPGEPSARRHDVDFSPKATSDGTEITIPVSGAPRWLGAALVAVVALVIGVVGMTMLIGPKKEADGAAAGASASGSPGESSAAASLGAPSATAATAATAMGGGGPGGASGRTAAGTNAGANGSPAANGALANGASASGVKGASGGVPVAAAGAKPGATTSARVGPNGGPATSPAIATSGAPPPIASGAPASGAPAAVPAAPEAPYNPAGAHVVLGALTHERVRDDAVRSKMVEATPRLSECYRTALRMAGKPVPGSAEIHMSIDERGAIQPIVSAPKHPEFARCAQGVLAGQRVPASALDGAGATASQWLTLQP